MNKTEIINKYKESCNELAELVNKQLFDGFRDEYWIADRVGEICDYGDTDLLSPDEMLVILENNMTYEQYAEWRDANLENQDKGCINLTSWIMGCRHNML